MDSVSTGCRLCLDSFAESFTTIDSPELKDQMEKCFWFLIEPKQGYYSGVCQSCSYVVSEFYQFSEKVRQNQELLNGNVTHCDTTMDSKITLENVEADMVSNYGLPETTEPACKPTHKVTEEEEVPFFNSKNTLESVEVETFSNYGISETTEDACEPTDKVTAEGEVPFINSMITLERVKVETLSDSETPEHACELMDKVSEEDVTNIDSTISLETVKIELPSDSGLPETTENAYALNDEDDSSSGEDKLYEPLPKKSRTIRQSSQKRIEEDQLFNKHFSMICDLCGISVATFSVLRTHFRQEHKRHDGYVVCCNKKLFKRYALNDHIDFHANPDVFRCEVCGNRYKCKETLKIHMLKMHSNDPFKCDQCPQSFPRKSVLAQHVKQHAKVECPVCNKMLASKNSLSHHMAKQHSGKDRTLVCNICGETFLSTRSFKRHMDAHKGIEVPRLQCGICQTWLKGEKGLRTHMQFVHTDGNQEFQCDICLRKYPHYQALYKHKLWTHREPKHECEFCGKKFKKASSLKEHRAIHTGKVVHTCEHCGIEKNCRASLYQHKKQQHPTERRKRK